ncbi:MAG: hypothetical protein HYW00_01485 [Candidatus Colwellbacteria bacterium]|nr:hypothetical protein [Candidatus Colwellbacteria bacterium]
MIALLVITLRLLLPLTILRWPLAGGLLALTADLYDFVVFNKISWGFLTSETYQPIDKLLDIYYLSLEVYAASKWNDLLAKKTAISLFFWRLAGVIIFELTQLRKFLFFAPNIFEYFYLVFLSIKRFKPDFRLQKRSLIILLLVIGIPKLVWEFILHYLEYPLGIANSWAFLKEAIFK